MVTDSRLFISKEKVERVSNRHLCLRTKDLRNIFDIAVPACLRLQSLKLFNLAYI